MSKKVIQLTGIVVILMLAFSLMSCQRSGSTGDNMNITSGNNEKAIENNKKVSGGPPEKLKDPNLQALVWDEVENIKSVTDAYETKYGGKITFTKTTWKEAEQKVITAMSAGDFYDIIRCSTREITKFAAKELIQPIDNYFDFKDPIWSSVLGAMDQFKYKGHYYGVSREIDPFVTIFNETLFENNGVKTPLKYYEEGNWTWETLKKVAIELTQDTNRDGLVDQWGFFEFRPQNMVVMNGADFVKIKDDGNVELTLNDTNVIEALQFFQDANYKYKYMTPGKWQTEFPAGKLAIIMDRVYNLNSSPIKGTMKDKWEIAPYPKAPSGKSDIAPGITNFYSIGNGAKNPEGASAFLYLYRVIMNQEQEMQMKEYLNDKQIKLINELRGKVVINKFDGIGDMNTKINPFINDIKKGLSLTSTIDKHSPVLQAEIDMFLGSAK